MRHEQMCWLVACSVLCINRQLLISGNERLQRNTAWLKVGVPVVARRDTEDCKVGNPDFVIGRSVGLNKVRTSDGRTVLFWADPWSIEDGEEEDWSEEDWHHSPPRSFRGRIGT